jgi:hypothetical protein
LHLHSSGLELKIPGGKVGLKMARCRSGEEGEREEAGGGGGRERGCVCVARCGPHRQREKPGHVGPAALMISLFGWRVAGGWFVLRENYCWLVADKPSEWLR